MARLAVTLSEELLKLARQASAKADVPLSKVVDLALRHFIATAGVGPSTLVWPAAVPGARPLTARELCDAIDQGRA